MYSTVCTLRIDLSGLMVGMAAMRYGAVLCAWFLSLAAGAQATAGLGAQHSLLSVAVNRSSYEWLLSEFPHVDLTRPRFGEQDDGLVKVDLYQSREEFAMLRSRFPAEFAGAEVVAGEGEVQAMIVAERERLSSRVRVQLEAPLATRKQEFFSDFRDYDEITAYVDALLLEPSIEVRRITIGETREGRPIQTYEFTGTGGLQKPTVYLQGTAHANEWMGTMACVYSMTELVERYAAAEPEIVELMDSLVFVATPVLNVDGYLHTWTPTGRNWRKNRRDNGDGSFGVDLNRNNAPERTWCTAGSSTNPSSNTFCGPAVLSEPEDRAYNNLLAQLAETQPVLTAVDFHTCGSLLLWPWQYTFEQLPIEDRLEFELVGRLQEDAINEVQSA